MFNALDSPSSGGLGNKINAGFADATTVPTGMGVDSFRFVVEGKAGELAVAGTLPLVGKALELKTLRLGDEEFVTLFHGTYSNRASKIVGNELYSAQGFKAGGDGLVFFAEDYKTAEAFALESAAKYRVGEQLPKSFTVMKLKIPRALAEDVGLHEPQLIGTARELPAIQPGDSPFERILTSDKLDVFNDALINGHIDVQRLKVK